MTKQKQTNKQPSLILIIWWYQPALPMFFFGSKFHQNGENKSKKNIVSQYFSFLGKNHQILKLKILQFYLPHFNYAFSLVAIF